MKLLVVNYRREVGQDDPDQAARLLESAERLSGLPGLVWKIWIYDDSRQAAGSVYLFEDEEHARAWGDGAVKQSLGRHPGVSDIETTYYDVDERLERDHPRPARRGVAADLARQLQRVGMRGRVAGRVDHLHGDLHAHAPVVSERTPDRPT